MVLRTAVGGGLQVGAQHSQMLEAWLTHVPGLKVVVPSTPSDARGLLASCIADDDPCVFIEQVPLLVAQGSARRRAPSPSGVADVKRPGDRRHRRHLRAPGPRRPRRGRGPGGARGVEVEVLDLRSLVPLDEDAVLESVGRTRRAVVLHEAVVTGGFGAELAARHLRGALRPAAGARAARGRGGGAAALRRATSSAWPSPGPARLLEAAIEPRVIAYRRLTRRCSCACPRSAWR